MVTSEFSNSHHMFHQKSTCKVANWSTKVHLNNKLADKYTTFLANWLAKVHLNTV